MATTYKTNKQKYKPSKGEKIVGKSVTVPNEAFTTRELLMKHANGTLYDNIKTPFYEEQSQFSTQQLSKMQSMYTIDKLIYLKEIQAKAKDLEIKIQSYKDEQIAIQEARIKELEAQKVASNAVVSDPKSE
jgi:hypothetical protein